MPLSWNEIKTRAADFVNEWKDKAPAAREESDARAFQIGFFSIFGLSQKKIAGFRDKVKLYRDNGQILFAVMAAGSAGLEPRSHRTSAKGSGYIDMLWEGHILIEMKNPRKDLEKAYEQAKKHALALDKKDFPKAIVICDFVNFHYYDLLEDDKQYRFQLSELLEHIELFGDLAGHSASTPSNAGTR
jgi:hypothetical protein